MRSSFLGAVVALQLILPAMEAAEVLGGWTTTGPEGATVLSLAVDPLDSRQVYAGTDRGGVFVSSDAGEHWSFSGLGGQRVVGLAIDSVETSRLYARTTSRLYRSANRGISWTDISPGLPLGGSSLYTTVSLSALEIEPAAPGGVYAAVTSSTLGGTHVYNDGALLKSSDGGQTWDYRMSGATVGSIAFDPGDPHTLYAGVTAGGTAPQPSSIRKSVDGGMTWMTVRDNLASWAAATALAAAPTTRGKVYAVYSNLVGPSFLEMTSDAGATWLPLAPPPAGSPTALALADGFLYVATSAALYRSSDEGSTWIGVLDGAAAAVRAASAGPTILYSGGNAVSVSQDLGDNWTSSSSGLTNTSVIYLAGATAPAGTLYSSSGHTIFRRAVGESAWQPFSSVPANVFVQSVAVDPTNPLIQLAGIMTYGCSGVLLSTDGGTSWAPSGLNTGCILRITFDPRNPGVVFAQGQFGLWRSLDRGFHWGDPVQAAFADLAFDPRRPQVVFAATSESVLRSSDGGATWLPSDAGIPLSRFGCSADGTVCPKRRATAIAIDPQQGSLLYAAAADVPISFNLFDPPVLDAGLFRSGDGGATWKQVGSGLPPGTALAPHWIVSLVVDPADSNTVYAASSLGVFRSTDRGLTFAAFDEGLVNSAVSFLLFDASGKTLHAATRGNGVFDVEIPRDRSAVSPVSRRRPTVSIPPY